MCKLFNLNPEARNDLGIVGGRQQGSSQSGVGWNGDPVFHSFRGYSAAMTRLGKTTWRSQ